jgi:hypothetical protein
LKVEPAGENQWRIVGPPDPDAAILLKNLTSPGAQAWYGSYAILEGNEGMVSCEKRPVIGVAPDSQPLRTLLEQEGYAVCDHIEPSRCALYLDRPGALAPGEQVAIVQEIEQSPARLVRLARWPRGTRSAMSVTGDIDALTLGDFLLRAWEVR